MITIFPRYYHRLESVYKELLKPINDSYSVIKINHNFAVRTGIGDDGPVITGNAGDYLVCMDKKLISIWRAEDV